MPIILKILSLVAVNMIRTLDRMMRTGAELFIKVQNMPRLEVPYVGSFISIYTERTIRPMLIVIILLLIFTLSPPFKVPVKTRGTIL